MRKLFGTDGIRGRVNVDLTAELALDVSVAAAHVLGEIGELDDHPTALVGCDPRASGEFLTAAVVAGLASAGVEVIQLGVLPTPGVAWLVGHLDADFGVMVSASHNPMPDNGIKFFARGGSKLDDDIEDQIERRVGEPWQRPVGAKVGRVRTDAAARDAYVQHLVDSLGLPANGLQGLKVVLDCAHGAASVTGPQALSALGAEVIALNADPDGLNINDGCGSTHPEGLQEAVLATGADLGLALDGDADRCLGVDAQGNLVDGDQILAILALSMAERGQLADNTVVSTVLSNLGFLQAMERHGIVNVTTKVGDRYVLEAMRAGSFSLGGEQSGHVVLSKYATTGDGVLTGLHLMARMAETGRSLAELAQIMTRLPQIMINVAGIDKTRVQSDAEVAAAVTAANQNLNGSGRVLLRPSGTEPVVRVMVEAGTMERARAVAEELAELVRIRLQ